MSSKAVAVIAAVLSLLVAVSDGSPECFDVTQYFTFTANSTCGDPPTTFLTENGDELNCTLGDHDASFAVDRDSETWWQSEPGVDQVELLFTLREVWRCTLLLYPHRVFTKMKYTPFCSSLLFSKFMDYSHQSMVSFFGVEKKF